MTRELQNILLAGLDENLSAKRTLCANPSPPMGWLRAVREALGLSQQAVAKRLGVRQQTYADMEKREADGTLSLANFRRAADALGCDEGRFLVPKAALADSFVALARRENPAFQHLRATEHSMALEGQAVGDLLPEKS